MQSFFFFFNDQTNKKRRRCTHQKHLHTEDTAATRQNDINLFFRKEKKNPPTFSYPLFIFLPLYFSFSVHVIFIRIFFFFVQGIFFPHIQLFLMKKMRSRKMTIVHGWESLWIKTTSVIKCKWATKKFTAKKLKPITFSFRK